MPVIGVLDTERPVATAALRRLDVAFRQGLLEAGYVEGANVDVAHRYAEGQYDRFNCTVLNAAARPDQPCICQTEPRLAGCQAAAPDQ
jgi:hypothetical protein